ncbi:MAG: DUF1772 domain-containing protein [Hyphomonadaceae bacterium]|nr:DUF1772 domain-containing protein [Hyphomonadaceae bacterium]
MILTVLGLAASTAFAGAALYVNLAEHPARLALDDTNALRQWKPSYAKGALMQASLAMVGGLLGLAAWLVEGSLAAGIGGLLVLSAWPWTLFVIAPVNNRLKATPPDQAGAETRTLLSRWGQLHAVRTLLGLASAAAYIAALV